jgi:hypothetical protein
MAALSVFSLVSWYVAFLCSGIIAYLFNSDYGCTFNSLGWAAPSTDARGSQTIVYAVMISLGEMIAYLPIPGGHIKLAERFVDPALSFTMGWNYWYNWTIILPAELSAAATLMHYWADPKFDPLWIVICFLVVLAINLLGAGAYGEAEFIFASIKVLTVVGLIVRASFVHPDSHHWTDFPQQILGIILDLGGGPNHDRIGFRYWKHPGPFVQYHGISGTTGRFLGWWAVMVGRQVNALLTPCAEVAYRLKPLSLSSGLKSLPLPLVKRRTPAAIYPEPSSVCTSVSYCFISVVLPLSVFLSNPTTKLFPRASRALPLPLLSSLRMSLLPSAHCPH